MGHKNNVLCATIALSQIVGVLICALIVYWRQLFYCGFDINNAPRLLNLHSLLTTVGYIVLFGEALLVIQMGYCKRHHWLLFVYVLLTCASLCLGVAGLGVAVFFYRQTDKVGFYSLHSWLGVCIFFLHALQCSIGFVNVYTVRKKGWFRVTLFKLHMSSGVIVLGFAAATCLMGLTRVNFLDAKYPQLSRPTFHSNILGMLIVVFVGLIASLILHYGDQGQRSRGGSTDGPIEDYIEHTKPY